MHPIQRKPKQFGGSIICLQYESRSSQFIREQTLFSHEYIIIFIIIIISINQIDTCHTTNISKGRWFIHIFKKH
jgi:hypothetical protein